MSLVFSLLLFLHPKVGRQKIEEKKVDVDLLLYTSLWQVLKGVKIDEDRKSIELEGWREKEETEGRECIKRDELCVSRW